MKTLREALVVVMVVAACSPLAEDETNGSPLSHDEAYTVFQGYVATANRCWAGSDCTLVVTQCPLGCYSAVRADRKADVEARARQLLARHRAGPDGECRYRCPAPGPVACVAGTCRAGPAN